MYEQIKALKIRVINLALFLFKLGVLVDYTIMDMGASKLIRLLSRVLVSIKLLTYGHNSRIGLIQCYQAFLLQKYQNLRLKRDILL